MYGIRKKSWADIVSGFVSVTLGGFHNLAWSEDHGSSATTGTPAHQALWSKRIDALDQQVKPLQTQVQSQQEAHNERLVSPGQPGALQKPARR